MTPDATISLQEAALKRDITFKKFWRCVTWIHPSGPNNITGASATEMDQRTQMKCPTSQSNIRQCFIHIIVPMTWGKVILAEALTLSTVPWLLIVPVPVFSNVHLDLTDQLLEHQWSRMTKCVKCRELNGHVGLWATELCYIAWLSCLKHLALTERNTQKFR